jgi:hypothetical protein
VREGAARVRSEKESGLKESRRTSQRHESMRQVDSVNVFAENTV